MSVEPTPSPDVAQLTSSVRALTTKARLLSREIHGALEELYEFKDDVAELRGTMHDRRSATPGEYTGVERRRARD